MTEVLRPQAAKVRVVGLKGVEGILEGKGYENGFQNQTKTPKVLQLY